MTQQKADARFEKYVPSTFIVAHHEGCSDAKCSVAGGIDLIISAGNYDNSCRLTLVTKKGIEVATYPEEQSEHSYEKNPTLRLENVRSRIAAFLQNEGYGHLVNTVLKG